MAETPLIKIFDNNIIYFLYYSQYQVTSSFMRVQEFYESPLKGIKNNYFSHETFFNTYAKANNWEMDYYSNWAGFNIPGEKIDLFKKIFHSDLWVNEKTWINKLPAFKDKFYIIATYSNQPKNELKLVLNHELAHSFYYLHETYKKSVDELIKSIPDKIINNAYKYLTDGYAKEVFNDEIQAILSTSKVKEIKEIFNFSDEKVIKKFKSNFRKFKKSKC